MGVGERFRGTFLKKGGFGYHLAGLMSGNIAAQAITFAVSPVLTRLYDPASFGIYSAVMAATAIIAIFASGRYETAVVMPTDDAEAWNLVRLGGLIATGVCGLLLVVALLPVAPWVASHLSLEGHQAYLTYIPVSSVLLITINLLTEWQVRKRRFAAISWSRVTQAGVTGGVQCAFGLAVGGPGGLVVAMLVGQLTTIAWLYLNGRDNRSEARSTPVEGARLKAVAAKYREFPRQLILASMANKLTENLPVFLLGSQTRPEVVGFFALAQRVIRQPQSLMVGSVSQIFTPKAVALATTDRPKLARDTARLFLGLSGVALVPTVILAVWAPEIVAFVFGARWEEAGVYVQWMSPYLFLQFAVSPLTPLFKVLEELKIYKRLEWMRLALATAGLYLGGSRAGAIGAVQGYSLAMSITYIATGLIVWRLVKRPGPPPLDVTKAPIP